jgi:tRNA pseudouridine38-40 synthase
MNSRIAMLIEYDGSSFHGWQFQPNLPTVQGAIQAALKQYCGQVVELQCAGRTDTGVHAIGQVAHADLVGAHDANRVMEAVNFHLRRSEFAYKVAVIAAQNAPSNFHARFSSKSRRYQYRIIVRRSPLVLEQGLVWRLSHPLNVAAMREAAELLLGEHNFNSFRSSECQAKSAVKTLDMLEIVQDGNRIIVNVKAKSFLHNQVRIMVGTLVEIGRGRYEPQIIAEMIAGNHRRCAGMTASPDGLFFMEVEYDDLKW